MLFGMFYKESTKFKSITSPCFVKIERVRRLVKYGRGEKMGAKKRETINKTCSRNVQRGGGRNKGWD